MTLGIICGSGLGVLGDQLSDAIAISYDDIPYFEKSNVIGHAGQLVIGRDRQFVELILSRNLQNSDGKYRRK